MPELISRLRAGLPLPPSGWALAAMLAFYVLAGLFGRDPWKGEDAIHIAATWNVLAHNDWLSPELAGRAFHEPPLYYWVGAATGKLLGGVLALHDAIRLASGIWVSLALVALYYAGRELYGKESAAASPLLLAGSFGLVINAHDAQPLLIALTSYCATLAAITAFERKPRTSGIFYGLALAACLLGCGIAPALPLLVVGPLTIGVAQFERGAWRACFLGWGVFVCLTLPWPFALGLTEAGRLEAWLSAEWQQLNSGTAPVKALGSYAAMLPVIAFPTLFIAGWSLWAYRKKPISREVVVPAGMLALTLLMLVAAYRPKELPALLMLPPLALLATPGALSLRRGAASAFDWFAMMSVTFFAVLVWVGWSALSLGWPHRLAQRAVVLRPGFVGHVDPIAVAAALAGTGLWLWLMMTTPRSPYRSLVHWAMGFTTFWLLASLLWLPWFDYGRSYRSVAMAVARQLPPHPGCIAEKNLGDTQRASFAYFIGVEPVPLTRSSPCRWLLVQNRSENTQLQAEGWAPMWEGSRPGDRRERFTLFQRVVPVAPGG